jgi:hypothetical protein
MARMPEAANAAVPAEKIVDYLLSRTHPVGSRKAVFFRLFGFDEHAPNELMKALLAHAAENEVSRVLVVPHGTKYEITGPLATPSGRTPLIRSVWIVIGGAPPRFVTAVPEKAKKP